MTLLEQVRGGDRSMLDRLRDRSSEIGSRSLIVTGALVVGLSVIFIAMEGLKLFWVRFLDALANGFIYGAVALALVLIYKATGVINFAQGSMAMFFSFFAWVLAREQGWPVWLGILTSMVVSAIFASIFEKCSSGHSTRRITFRSRWSPLRLALRSMEPQCCCGMRTPKVFQAHSRRTRKRTTSISSERGFSIRQSASGFR